MRNATVKLIVGLLLTLGISLGAVAEPIKIGWTAWSDAEFVTKLAARLIEKRMGHEVKLIQTDIAPQYQGLATGSIDFMMMSWQPITHEDYMNKVGNNVVDLGILYGYARLGWVVPDYVPQSRVNSIADLNKKSIREKLEGRITGIDPGAGLTRLSKKAVEVYGLKDYELQISSGAGMTAALERAIRRNEWIVVTGWSPHWMFGAYKLRYLQDPKGVLGSYERVHVIARRGFYQQFPKLALMLSRMFLPIDQLQHAMYDAQQRSYEKAIDTFIKAHPHQISYWLTGELK
ncbi:glycine betaine ABC transporter substrate-binding protein [Zooshikella harenae]|uniref:Glycine betaine ABC transporter substrate-binding protein n=1 Tax=Zooshikella harenae TaxID=2827238 RepID=A0ABS5Z6D9_9GAMM|nr:glycine betaine ABC transporter substrate-binding protein [Zooshikella harenae]MBU2709559.1 glycine betaine ABC transporter substrate-binding protein [Zooshikella harenae]